MSFYDYKVAGWLPEGRSGEFAVERFTVSKKEAALANMRAAFAFGGRSISPGTYTRLVQGETVWMSDTPAEVRDHIYAIKAAHDYVLVTGLGLGMVAAAMLAQTKVRQVTVVEQQREVIELVEPHLLRRFGPNRVRVVHADAYVWTPEPGAKFDYAWHDVWPEISSDNLPEFARMRRHYQRRMTTKDSQGCWCEAMCRHFARGGR